MTAPFDSAGYAHAWILAIQADIALTTWDRPIEVGPTWYSGEDVYYSNLLTAQPARLILSPVRLSDGQVTVEIGDPDGVLAAMIADGSIIGRQAHLIERTLSGATWTTHRDWHMLISQAGWSRGIAQLVLAPMRYSSLLGPGIYGRQMLQRCNWAFNDASCLAAATGTCAKTLTACKSFQMNLLANDNTASVETDASGWSGVGGATIARTTAAAYHGLASLSVSGSATGAGAIVSASGQAPVAPGAQYWASAYLRLSSGANTVRLRVVWYDSSGTQVGVSTEYADLTPTQSWQRISVLATAPAGAAYARPRLTLVDAASTTFYIDCAQIEKKKAVWQTQPQPWALPSWGNARRFGGFVAPPVPGQTIRYWIARPGAPAEVVQRPERTVPALPPPPPQPEQPRTPRRVISPAPPPQPAGPAIPQPTPAPSPPRRRLTPG